MNSPIKKTVLFVVLLSFTFAGWSQDDEPEIDASKPTNFYTQLDNTLENTSSPGQNVFGYRGKFLYAPSEAHLILGEVPLLYNDRTSKFGLGDLRARYFWLPYKNYDKFLGAFGPSVDVFMPTGSLEDGLGSGRWVVSPGITVGLMAADWIQFFPVLSYQYASEVVQDNAPPNDEASNGLSFQVITPIVFSEKFFVQVTPIYRINDFRYAGQDRFVQEIFAAYTLKPGLQLTSFYNGNFQDSIHQVSLGLTLFL